MSSSFHYRMGIAYLTLAQQAAKEELYLPDSSYLFQTTFKEGNRKSPCTNLLNLLAKNQ